MQNPKVRRRTMVVFAAAVLLAALLLLSQSVWAAPGQDHLRQTVPHPPTECDINLVIHPQTSGDNYTFIYTPAEDVICAPPAGCSNFCNYTIEAYLGTQLVDPVSFDPPLEICMVYSQAVADANGGAENLALVYWDDDTGAWIPLDNGRYDPDLQMVCGDISFLPDNACGIGITCSISPTGVPVTGEETGAANMTPALLVLAAGLVLVFGTSVWRRRVESS